MRKYTGSRSVAVAVILAVGLAAGSALHAQDEQRSPRPDSTPGMMGEGGTMGMMGTMRRMGRMGRMMNQCAGMMGAGSRPNDQWRGQGRTPEKQ